MTDAYIYDSVRTPRGKGKKTGSLHQISPVKLASKTLMELQKRNSLNTSFVDDVILDCVQPINEQGSDIARNSVKYFIVFPLLSIYRIYIDVFSQKHQ